MQYVTYDAAGALTGAYWQDLLPEHKGHAIAVTPEQYAGWTGYRANAARTGLEPVSTTPPPPGPVTIEQVQTAVQQRLDAFARTRNYDGILSACTYATSSIPKFRAEGQAAVDGRDATWARCYEILAEVEAGSRPAPTDVAQVLTDLPALAWPAAE